MMGLINWKLEGIKNFYRGVIKTSKVMDLQILDRLGTTFVAFFTNILGVYCSNYVCKEACATHMVRERVYRYIIT